MPIKKREGLMYRPYPYGPIANMEAVNSNLESFQNLSGWCSTTSRSPSLESATSPQSLKISVQKTTSPQLMATSPEGDLQTPVFDFEDELDFVKSPESLYSQRSELISTSLPQNDIFWGEFGIEGSNYNNMYEYEYEDKVIETSSTEVISPETFPGKFTDDDDEYITAIRPQDMHFQNDSSNLQEKIVVQTKSEILQPIVQEQYVKDEELCHTETMNSSNLQEEIVVQTKSEILHPIVQELCVKNEEFSHTQTTNSMPPLLYLNTSLEPVTTEIIHTPDVIQLIDEFDLVSYVDDGSISTNTTVEISDSNSNQSVTSNVNLPIPSNVNLTIPDIVVLDGEGEVCEVVEVTSETIEKSRTVRASKSRKRKSVSESQDESVKRHKGATATNKRKIEKAQSQRQVAEDQRYREMRDRNNEASRKSRQSRKEKDSEMNEKAAVLEKENNILKLKVESLESLRDTLKQLLLQSVKPKDN